jgi:hypothetical protein
VGHLGVCAIMKSPRRTLVVLMSGLAVALLSACASAVPSATEPVHSPTAGATPSIAESCEGLPVGGPSCAVVVSTAIGFLPTPPSRVVAARVVNVPWTCPDGLSCPAPVPAPNVAYLGLTIAGEQHVVGLEVGIMQDGHIVPLP